MINVSEEMDASEVLIRGHNETNGCNSRPENGNSGAGRGIIGSNFENFVLFCLHFIFPDSGFCFFLLVVDAETALYTELWRACAGPLVTVPREHELVFYFPQGHIEQVLPFFVLKIIL